MTIALFPSLAGEFRVTAFDRPGHGRNRAPGGGGPWLQAAELNASMRALGLVRPVLVGHSFGGAVALAHALQFPDETAGVVALAPIAFPEPRLEHVLFAPRAVPGPMGFWCHSVGRMTDPVLLPILWRAMFLPQAPPPRFEEEFPFDLAGQADRVLSDGQDALGPGVAWNSLSYGGCRPPVHIVAGDRDIVVNPALHAEGLAMRLPRARLIRLPGLGHMAHHFAQPVILDSIRQVHRLQ
jgi:pimeloyl-ACP methyl ester carboxylesterase